MRLLQIAAMTVITVAIGYSQTQREMNEQARQEYQRADEQLNAVYNQILKKYGGDAAFLKKLRAAQLAWIRFRDAHVEALYPATDKQREYGSVYPVCRYQALKPITEERTKQLRQWLEEPDETDTCRGSRGASAAAACGV